MPGVKRFGRGLGPIGVALTMVDVWQRMSPKQRRWVLQQARTHGPRIAKQVAAARKRDR